MSVQVTNNDNSIVNPQRFVVWLLIISIIMLFAGLTSGYLVRRGTGDDWIPQELPTYFTISTIVAILSSITMHLSVLSFKKGKLNATSLWVSLTLLLGLLFTTTQVLGVYEWYGENVSVMGTESTPRTQFVFVLAATHFAHIALALLFLIVLFVKSRIDINKSSFSTWLSNSAVFWHFLGLLWLYLFIFLNVIP